MKKEKFACILCGSEDYHAIFSYSEPDQYEKAVGVANKNYSRQWVKCKKCGFYYSIYSRDKDVLDKIYASAYRSEKMPWRKGTPEEIFRKVTSLSEKESETKLRVKWIKQNIESLMESGIVKQSDPPFKMLDIGGATGVFAYEFQDKDWISNVIDPDEAGRFMEGHKINFVRDYYKPGKFGHKFDLVCLVYVLEHLKNPVPLLESLHADMAENSLLYIEVPDSISFGMKPKEDDIFNSCHLWMFNPSAMATLLNRCGYRIMSLKRLKTIRGHYSLMVLAGQKQNGD